MLSFRRLRDALIGPRRPDHPEPGRGPRAPGGLPDYACQYLDSLVEEYRLLSLEPRDERAARTIEEILKQERLTLGDLFVIERMLLRLEPPERIRRRAWGLRDRYRTVVGEQAYAEYLGSSPPDPADPTVSPAALQADLDQILGEFHWLYQITPIREGVRNRISQSIAAGMLVALVVLLGAIAVDYVLEHRTNLSTIWMILFMGALGAFVSLQHRIQSIPSTGDAILNILALRSGGVSVFLTPIGGSVFAFILYLAFSAGLVRGALFPEMNTTVLPAPCASAGDDPAPRAAPGAGDGGAASGRGAERVRNASFGYFLWHSIPRNNAELAKLLLWCFIAGFAERLIPGTLDRIIVRKVTVLTDEPPRSSIVIPTGSRPLRDDRAGFPEAPTEPP